MTGEMSEDDLKYYPQFFNLARRFKRAKLNAKVRPFDVYQGPYVLVENRVRIWGTEHEGSWFIEDRKKECAGYTVPNSNVVKVTKPLLRGQRNKIPKRYCQRYT